MLDGNFQITANGKAVSNTAPIPSKLQKGTSKVLFGGAIAASVTESNATAIDMTGYEGGSLEVVVNSGTGTFSIALFTKETNAGTFVQMDKMKTDGSGMEDFPAIVTTASTSKSYSISGIRANYIKFVPTLTGTANVTITFTPAN
ncbi:hypothetical protein [Clostridium saccharoperbutylacetonicum]|uniref:hypothetical protein n=1 Tax=Clostridium saccharoperbutylacetonicum TaxID=36745 RepID=UPI0039E9C195